MMETYKVGRGTLRESLRFLEFEGVLSFKPGPGGGPVIEKPNGANLATTLTLVLQFDHARYQVVSEARQAFEPLMAQLAAERMQARGPGRAGTERPPTGTDIADVDAYLHNNQRFHEIIAWASGNSLFGFLVDAMVGGPGYQRIGAGHRISAAPQKRGAGRPPPDLRSNSRRQGRPGPRRHEPAT